MPELLTIKQVAARLNLSTTSVRALCDNQKLRAFRPLGPNGHRRIYADSVDAFLSNGKPDSHRPLAVPQDEYDDTMADLERAFRASMKAK